MARLTPGQRAARVLEFLMGLNNPRIASALGARGFTEADRQEGYARLKQLTDNRLDTRPTPPADASALEALDLWENQWFPIIFATLRFRYPKQHGDLFLNLAQTTGPELVITIDLLLRRIETLAKSSDPEASTIMALLASRGVDATELARGRDLVTKATSVRPEAPGPAVDPAEFAARQEHLWQWYLEWSEIARVAVKDRRLQRELGFLQIERRDDEDVVAPAPAPAPAA